MADVIRLKRKPRPLKKSYHPEAPYVVERTDEDDGSITFEVLDERQESYRVVCRVTDDMGRNGYALHDAHQIARGLNLMIGLGKETLPKVVERPDSAFEHDDDDGED